MQKIYLPLFAFGFLLCAFAALWGVVQSAAFLTQTHLLSTAVTLDALFVIPLVYIGVIARTSIPKTTVVPVLIASSFFAAWVLPSAHQELLQTLRPFLIAGVEVVVFGFVVWKVRSLVRALQGQEADVLDVVRTVLSEHIPARLVPIFVTEFAMVYYGLVVWRKPDTPNGTQTFTSYRETGVIALLVGGLVLVVFETMGLHAIVMRWSPAAAWVLTVLSLYTFLQGLSLAKSFVHRQTSATSDVLRLRHGLFAEVTVPWSDVEWVKLDTQPRSKRDEALALSPLYEVEQHNIRVRFRSVVKVRGVYGHTRETREVVMHLDDAQAFISVWGVYRSESRHNVVSQKARPAARK